MNTEDIYISLESKKGLLGLGYAIGIIQLRGGFRISEVLKLTHENIINETDIYIIADKGSMSKRVHVPELTKLLIKWKVNEMTPFKGISRFAMYRLYKRLGIVVDNGKNKNKSVTHAMRKNFVQENFKSTGSIEIAAELVGHKSSKSTEYYVKRKGNGY